MRSRFRRGPTVVRPSARSSPSRTVSGILVPVVAALVLTVVSAPSGWASKIRPARTRFGNGDWVVGRQVAPGTYWTQGATSLPPNAIYGFALVCYWERDKDLKGGPALGSDIIAGQDIVTILRTDGRFDSQNCGPSDKGSETQGCKAWTNPLSLSAAAVSTQLSTVNAGGVICHSGMPGPDLD
jgi:hypothetical protein